MPAASGVIVNDVVLPVMFPGLIVQLPAGRPFSTTDAVGDAHVGCVTVPRTGVVGVTGGVLITTSAVAVDVQPAALVTVKLYVPAARPVIVLVAPVPVMLPGLIVQLPAGRPFSITEPVGVAHVGCVMPPTTGVAGAAGAAFTVTGVADEIQPAAFFTVTL